MIYGNDSCLIMQYITNITFIVDSTVDETGVSLNKTSTTLAVGGTEAMTATVATSDATDLRVTWSSSNTAVATVDSNGKVTFIAPGTATITVTTTDGSSTCAVTVKAVEPEEPEEKDEFVPSKKVKHKVV